MKNKFYVHDHRFLSSSKKHSSAAALAIRILLILAACAVAFAVIFGGIYLYTGYSVSKTYQRFNHACAAKEYKEAIAIYRDVQEKTLTKSIFAFHQEKQKKILLDMEDQVNTMIRTPFYALTQNSKPFTSDDLSLITKFEELSARKISDLTVIYLQEYLLGKHPRNEVQTVLHELKRIDSLKDTMGHYEAQLGQIETFSPEMQAINTEFINKNYLEAASGLKTALEKQTGFIREYLAHYYDVCKKEMYPVLIKEIDVMMTGRKYYSAKSLAEQMILFFPDDNKIKIQLQTCETKVTKKLVEYTKPVEHLSFRPLIATTSLAFDHDNYAKNAEDLMLTTYEFKRILQQLYNNQYILIDINSLVSETGQKTRLFLPEGKKPVILSIEGLNYYAGRLQSGNSENLALDSEGRVASVYKNSSGDTVTDQNGEAVGILEQFVREHPDFSFDGAKGLISLTGYECIFGYVTNPDQVDDRTNAFASNGLSPFSITTAQIGANKSRVLEVINKLKTDGWSFASSTYGSIQIKESSLEQVKSDTAKWKEQVESLTGKVKVLLFPNGSIVGSQDPKGAYLIEQGFVIQAGIGPTAYFSYSSKHLYMDRVALTGIALRNQNLSRFFDVKAVYDPARTQKLK